MQPAIAPRQDRQCALCGVYETVGVEMNLHHWPSRSVGGTDTVLLCIACHNLSEDGRHTVSFTDDWVYLIEGGAIIQQRPRRYLSDDLVQTMVGELQAAPEHLERLSYHFDKLPDDALETVADAVVSIRNATWPAIGNLLRVWKQRIRYGQRGDQFQKLAQRFDLTDRRGYELIAAVDFAQAHPELRLSAEVPIDVVLEARKYGEDAPRVLEEYHALRAEHPRAGVTALRRALRDEGELHQVMYHACPECGANHARRD